MTNEFKKERNDENKGRTPTDKKSWNCRSNDHPCYDRVVDLPDLPVLVL